MATNIKDFAKELDTYFMDNHRYYCVYEYDGKLCIDIEWGDWKHDHLFADCIVEKKAEENGWALIACMNNITADNGSDCYSAEHEYRFST